MSLNILLNKSSINSLVFIEFITVTQYPDINVFLKEDPIGHELWYKSYSDNEENKIYSPNEFYHRKSAFNPIFSKIVASSAGMYTKDNHEKPVIKKFFASTEHELLSMISTSFYKMYESEKILSGFNLINYHIPFFAKRFFAGSNFNKIIVKNKEGENSYASFPALVLEQMISKPWEIKALDLMQISKFGSFYNSSFEQLIYHYGVDVKLTMNKEFISEYYWSKVNSKTNILELNEEMSNICSEYNNGVIKIYNHMRNVL